MFQQNYSVKALQMSPKDRIYDDQSQRTVSNTDINYLAFCQKLYSITGAMNSYMNNTLECSKRHISFERNEL